MQAKKEAEIVTKEEELAILQQTQRVEELENAEEKNREQELKLAIAKQKLTELIEASTGATREQESAERDLLRAQEEEERALEKLTKAQDKLIEAQKELNDVTAKTPENLLEIAIAKKALDDALKNLDALGMFENALGGLVESTGMKLQDLINMANAIKSGGNIPASSGGGGSIQTDTSGEVTPDIVDPTTPSGGGGRNVPSVIESGRAQVIINNNVKVEGKSADQQALDIAEATRRALRNGIRVIN